MPIIWPLATKLMHAVMLQKRPRWTGGRRIPSLPGLPWNDSERPPSINFGQVDYSVIAGDTVPINFGLCALAAPPVPLSQFLHPQRTRVYYEQRRVPAAIKANPPAVGTRFVISGVSRDATGAALAGCQVLVFRTYDKVLAAETTSDGSGAWSVTVDRQQWHFLVEYKAGEPPVFGTSPNTLSPS